MTWKPREEYRTLKERHEPILVRSKPVGPQGYLPAGPMVVIYTEYGPTPGGHFYPCPGVPIFYGNHQLGMLKHDDFDEWMEIPE
jgi:hypothetical protein